MTVKTAVTDHRTGIRLAAVGVLVLSFDALLIRLADVGHWDVAFWRGALMALSMGLVALIRTQPAEWQHCRKHPLVLFFLAALYGINGTLFVLSVSFTSVANTVVILSSSAFFAALFSWWILREKVARRTWGAILVSIAGVLTVFAGSMGLSNWLGDLFALVLALSMGLLLTLMRVYAGLPRTLMIAMSGLVMVSLVAPFSTPFTLPGDSYIWLLLMGLVQIPLASVLLMSATRYLSSPEVSLFLLIETVFGPIWVWLFLNEQVPAMTFWGGCAILGAVTVHSWLSLKRPISKN